VARLCRQAATELPPDVVAALKAAIKIEESQLGRQALEQLLENAKLAAVEHLPICQDCGTATVFLEIGQDIHFSGGDLYLAIQEGVKRGYTEGYLRKSQVTSPYSSRRNTGDNTPAVIHTDIVSGHDLRITVMPKGGGSENMTRLFMLTPSRGRQGVIDAVVKAIDDAGSNPCPPVIVGVGIGGSSEHAMLMAKKASLRPVGQHSTVDEDMLLEDTILDRANQLGIGPQGYGGKVTALAVHVASAPAHLASLPVAVQILCHAARRASETL
jgi:fumarate hydratase subunit alpha